MAMAAMPTRRRLLGLGLTAIGGALAGCQGESGSASSPTAPSSPATADRLRALIREAERGRRRAGARVVPVDLVPQASKIDLGGRVVTTWSYGGELPGRTIHVRAGDVLRARVRNQLPNSTSIHWHGIALRNDMDGVPDVTQAPIRDGADFSYEFVVPDPGTYWFHPHVGVQLDRGLYAPLIVDDPNETKDYDDEWVIVLDDWLDGVKHSPDDELAALQGMDHGSMSMGRFTSPALGGDAGDVEYPLYLLNGRQPSSPQVFSVGAPGFRVRIRLINAGGDTAFRFAIGGHRLTVIASDGFPVEPVEIDTLVVGMGERYDLLVDVHEGVYPVVALAEGKGKRAFGLLRADSGETVPAEVEVPELDRRMLRLSDLVAAESVRLPEAEPDSTQEIVLGGDMSRYRWTINGRTFEDSVPMRIVPGQRVRLRLDNRSTMHHPVHLHGHTFQVVRKDGRGPRKDTLTVLPKQRIEVDLVANNPGRWLVHCHNIYHAESGMMAQLDYDV